MLPIYVAMFVISLTANALTGKETGQATPPDLAYQVQPPAKETCEGCPERSAQAVFEYAVLEARAP